jgi:Holliday junction resolvase RusA-like endonuclease
MLRAFGEDVPDTARPIFDLAAARQWPSLSFAVPALPPSTNRMHTQVTRERRVLSAETVTFRQMTALAIGHRRHDWKPVGQVAALVFLAQPYWLTKKLTIREVDCDNMLKPLFDAIQHAVDVPDETNWEVHAWKITTTKRVQTAVYLFDLGGVVDVYL